MKSAITTSTAILTALCASLPTVLPASHGGADAPRVGAADVQEAEQASYAGPTDPLARLSLEYGPASGSLLLSGDAEGLAYRGRRRGRRPRRGYAVKEVIAACENHSRFRSTREHCILHALRIAGRRPAEAVRACGEETSLSSGFEGCIEAAARFRVAPARSIHACGEATIMNDDLVACVESASRYHYDPSPIIAYCDDRHVTGSSVISCVDEIWAHVRRRR